MRVFRVKKTKILRKLEGVISVCLLKKSDPEIGLDIMPGVTL
jgi:hypothetical protein